MVRIGISCAHCLRFVAYGPEAGPCPEPEWIEKCDWCLERERKAQSEVERLEQMWAARECVAPDCAVVFVPAQAKQRFHSDRCRKRTHWRQKAQLARAAEA
jgi:hypothetical protein